MHLLLVVAVALVVYFLLRKRGKSVGPASESSSVVDRWIKDALPGALAKHLAGRGLDRAQVARAVGGDPDPAVVSTLEQHVREVQVEYLREAHGPDVEVTLRVRFDDGAEETVRRRMTLGEVPAAVREDFDKKATTRVFRDWHFPWAQAL
jgi:hypothetical protein